MKEPPTEAALLLGKPKTRLVPIMKIQAGAYSQHPAYRCDAMDHVLHHRMIVGYSELTDAQHER